MTNSPSSSLPQPPHPTGMSLYRAPVAHFPTEAGRRPGRVTDVPSLAQEGRLSIWIAGAAAVLLLALRWIYAGSDLWNSDEPQHLHVVWAWANGLLPYRDVFDNHTPLFHILSVPLFRAIGERPDIIWFMRMGMIPLFGLSLWCIYRIGANVFSPRAGLWAAVLLGFFPKYFFLMGQYRTDVLWTVLWLGSLVVLTGGRLTRKRLFCAGLLVGAAFGVSMKTSLLLIIMSIAGLLAWAIRGRLAPRTTKVLRTPAETAASIGAALGGLLVVPLLIVGYFAMQGALGPLYYCVITHNQLPGDQTPARILHRALSWRWASLGAALLLIAAMRAEVVRQPRRATKQMFLILSAGLFFPILMGFWRMVTPQDYVPWFPLLALVIAPGLLLLERWSERWGAKLSLAILLGLTAGEFHWMLHHAPLFGPGSKNEMLAIADVLRLTDRGEFVMDPKGDLIFRPRPYYFALETLTRKRLSYGLMKDELPERLIETRTAVMKIAPERLTEHSLAFVRANYVSVGRLAVLGERIQPNAEGVASFEVTIPERYSFVTEHGSVEGTLDGQPLAVGQWLAAGHHELRLRAPAPTGAFLIWSRALDRGFSPFADPTAHLANQS